VSSNKKNLWIFIIEGNHLSFIFKRTMKELNGIFPAFEKRVKQLKEICKIDGRYELLQMEYFELISKVPAIEVRDFVFSFFKVAMVLYEEAWSLMTGQLLHRYQQEDVSFPSPRDMSMVFDFVTVRTTDFCTCTIANKE
jgi:hypothetical protein